MFPIRSWSHMYDTENPKHWAAKAIQSDMLNCSISFEDGSTRVSAWKSPNYVTKEISTNMVKYCWKHGFLLGPGCQTIKCVFQNWICHYKYNYQIIEILASWAGQSNICLHIYKADGPALNINLFPSLRTLHISTKNSGEAVSAFSHSLKQGKPFFVH